MTSQESKILDSLKKLTEKKTRINHKERILNEKIRKQETRRNIEIGALATRSGLADFDNETLAGAFAEVKEHSAEQENRIRWRQNGTRLSQNALNPLLISFKHEPSKELVAKLREKKFRWNEFRKEWQGYGVKEDLEFLVRESEGKIELVHG